VKFWDASALVPLLIEEPWSERLRALAAGEVDVLVWWGSRVECVSALARLERELMLTPAAMTHALTRLAQLADRWHEVDPIDTVRETAARFLRVHPLRADDALQLAAAFLASGGRPVTLEVVTLDDRLADAARKEGFAVVGPAATD
jgi:hypothetical protein